MNQKENRLGLYKLYNMRVEQSQSSQAKRYVKTFSLNVLPPEGFCTVRLIVSHDMINGCCAAIATTATVLESAFNTK